MTKLPLTHANIIQMLGIESLSLDDRKEILESTIELVEARTLNRVMEKLEEKDRLVLAELLERKDEEVISEFFQKNNVDLMALTEEEIEKVKVELLDLKKEESLGL